MHDLRVSDYLNVIKQYDGEIVIRYKLAKILRPFFLQTPGYLWIDCLKSPKMDETVVTYFNLSKELSLFKWHPQSM